MKQYIVMIDGVRKHACTSLLTAEAQAARARMKGATARVVCEEQLALFSLSQERGA